MRITRFVLPVLLLLLLAAPAALKAADIPVPTGIIDLEEQQVVCRGSELQGNGQLTGPAAYSTSHVTGEADAITLDVLLVLDLEEAVDVARIDRSTPEGEAAYQAAGEVLYQEVLERLEVAPISYEPLSIDLRWAGWDLLRPLSEDGTPRQRSTDTQTIINLAKAQYGGQRPGDVDIVYVASDLDLTALGTNAVAGQADCIGGVANPENAFAVGEIQHPQIPAGGFTFGPITVYKDYFAKIAAHEIGHLLGGHHHYQECATPGPATSALERGEPGPCTLMTNAVDFQTLPFSNLNGIVVRGHAEDYVADHDHDDDH